ncbi:MAG: ATP-binding protein [Candidatus Micrarchaeaceae archaeon]
MEILEIINPWWKEGKVNRPLAPAYHRTAFNELKKLIEHRQMVLLTGLRRVGKTTLMYQLIEHLMDSDTKSMNIVYFSFDERVENIIKMLDNYSEITGVNWKKERCFVFLDEIQKLQDWSNKIKLLYDSFPNLKLFVSGSASFLLEKGAKSVLVGRHFIIEVPPLSFAEYLGLKESKIDLAKTRLWENEIKKEFKNYILRPFPELVKLEELTLIKTYIKDNIIEKIARGDIASKFKNVNADLLGTLVNLVYSTPGMYINYDELSKDLKISKNTLLLHFYYMEFAYLIRRVKNFRPSTRATSRKLQRAYPFHWSLGFGWTGNVNFETIVASLLNGRYYWKDKGKEIDFLIVNEMITPIGAKESLNLKREFLGNLTYFMSRYKSKKGFLVYNGDEDVVEIGKNNIKLLPVWLLALDGLK